MFVFVVNKMAGSGKGLKVWKRTQAIIEQRNIEYQVEFTESSQEATEFVHHLTSFETFKALIVIGGDGTVQSILSEIIYSKVVLGIIPAGSGNDFARGLGIPLHTEKALNYIITGSVKKMDVIHAGDKDIVTIAGVGLDGQVAESVNKSKYKQLLSKLKLGRLAYVVGLFVVLLRYVPTSMKIDVDGQEYTFKKVWLVAIANLPYYGGGMKICPNARFDDALLNVCVVSGISRMKLLLLFPKVFLGSHIQLAAVTQLIGSKVRLSADQPMIVHGDGEVFGQTPIDVTIKQHAIRVFFNAYL